MSFFRRRPRPIFRAAATTAALAVTGACLVAAPVSAAIVPEPISYSSENAELTLKPVGTYESKIADASAAEIVAHHAASQRLFVVNAENAAVDVLDVLDVSDPTNPAFLFSITDSEGGVANSVAIRPDGLGVIALEAQTKTDAGKLVFFDATADAPAPLGSVAVGALPDMVTISEDGAYAVVANEGEPNDDYTVDPEGSISVVTLPETLAAPAQEAVKTATFNGFEGGNLPEGVRIFAGIDGADKPVSRGLEPEYIALDGGTAYAALQEANAVAVVDLATATVTNIWPLGAKDHGLPGNGLDTSDRDPEGAPTVNIRTVEGLNGLYMPDGINAYTAGGETYLVTANEGDAREWGTYVEPARVKDLGQEEGLAPICETSPLAGLTGDAELGRLNVSTASGLNAAGECYEELYAFGGRSFSIWSTDGTQVFDSGDAFEQITSAVIPGFFNSNHSESNLEGRTDDKGPEPENLTIGEINGRTYAFIGFERVGGIAVFDITDPANSTFETYLNNRNFAESLEDGGDLSAAGDLGPEGLTFIPAQDSPSGKPMIAVGNEVSGTATLFDVETKTTTVQVLGINDFHGRIEANGAEAGAAVLSGAVAQLREENPNTLFVSAGDNIGASTFTSFSQDDAPTIDALREAGLDVSAVGNHEFDRGFEDLIDRVLPQYGGGQFGLGANVYDAATGEPALDEYYVQEVDGVRVGFIGTVTEQTPSLVSPDGIAGLEFGSALEAANRVAGELQDGDEANGEADVIVLLSHDGSETTNCEAIGSENSKYGELVRGASPAIDAIISGHTHLAYDCSFPVEGWAPGLERPVMMAHQYGTTLDQLRITVNREDKSVVAIQSDLLPLTREEGEEDVPLYPADPEVAAIVDEASEQAEVVGAEVIGSITADITRGGENGSDRGVESSLGNLVADMQLWATSNENFAGEPAQIALMNPGGLRADLLYGEDGTVTYKDVASTQPFGNTLFTMDLTGAQLKQVLEEQWQPEGSSRAKLHLGISEGFSYTYDPAAARGEHILSMSYNGEPIADDDVFRVAANSFLAAGGDNFFTLADGTNRADSGQIDLVAAVEFFETFETVSPAPLGRAVIASEVEDGAWGAVLELDKTTVEQGGTVQATVSGLEPGQQIAATLFSEPVVIEGIPAADTDGVTTFAVEIPADFELGEHALEVSAAGYEPITATITVVAAATGSPGDNGDDSTNDVVPGTGGNLADTGANVLVAAGVGLLLALAGALLLMYRRRSTASVDEEVAAS
ncbi:bifunctional metallophosphatase/5'-nucleotidase [Arthrobacter sp. JZ12]|uniref:choice-of-anchor I family protein n=1 Tax=Arthrobacter sp. JZ12 TaxID=2654190 RepID=UPI002B47765C|nr:choice-of-anchor I family protein [Arthrobacter sp. JZ12]WRH24157.1 bifunctional metallophosphatase/5'-nucleotidase [Arthrobacter sp. JZ12]